MHYLVSSHAHTVYVFHCVLCCNLHGALYCTGRAHNKMQAATSSDRIVIRIKLHQFGVAATSTISSKQLCDPPTVSAHQLPEHESMYKIPWLAL